MYFSYTPSPPSTSYSSSAMEIPSSSSSSTSRPQSPSCAYPSWPRRSSMNSESSSSEAHTSSAFSDEELSCGLYTSVFEEEDCSPLTSPNVRSPSGSMCEPQYVVVDNAALMRELIAQHAAEKAAKKEKSSKKRHAGSRKSSRHGSGTTSKHMTPILEAGE